MRPGQARLRAIMGVLFCILGAAAAIGLLFRSEPIKDKLVGLGFCLVLVALGVVRVRTYAPLARKSLE